MPDTTPADAPADAAAPAVALGVDVGGTFTDAVAVGADGRVVIAKVLTTPSDRARGVLDALRALEMLGVSATRTERFAHGTTVVTNRLLERDGARTVLVATTGFTDVLALRRQDRASLYDLAADWPAPLVASGDVIGAEERVVVADGALRIERPLDDAAIRRVVDAVRERAPESVAVVLLHGYGETTHERALAAALREALPGVPIACGHEVLPELREYERTATTVAEAYARPAVTRYLASLAARCDEAGYPAPQVMTSTGGTLTLTQAATHAASLALSGPAGGVIGAAAVCRALGVDDALTIDIGGTSADVGLILHGEPLVERGGDVGGVPIALPRVLVETVAAGGGSIGWIDGGGALRAGPMSAGADPGPACYARGGTAATVTDAHVVLGHIDAAAWSGGVRIDADRARAAIGELARTLDVSVERCAAALIASADATMARALRRVSVERGVNPRDLPLLAFGGGGPLHACGLADTLGMRTVIVPPAAGVLSALGLAIAPPRREGLASTVGAVATRTAPDLAALVDGTLALHGADPARRRAWLRVRYVGQGHALDTPVLAGDDGAAVAARFATLHQERFGFVLDRAVESTSVRVTIDGDAWPLRLSRVDGIAAGATHDGPRVMSLGDATLRVAEGWRAEALPIGGWRLTRVDAMTGERANGAAAAATTRAAFAGGAD